MRVQFTVEADITNPDTLKKWVNEQYPGVLDEDSSLAQYALEALIHGSVPIRPEYLGIEIVDSYGSDS